MTKVSMNGDSGLYDFDNPRKSVMIENAEENYLSLPEHLLRDASTFFFIDEINKNYHTSFAYDTIYTFKDEKIYDPKHPTFITLRGFKKALFSFFESKSFDRVEFDYFKSPSNLNRRVFVTGQCKKMELTFSNIYYDPESGLVGEMKDKLWGDDFNIFKFTSDSIFFKITSADLNIKDTKIGLLDLSYSTIKKRFSIDNSDIKKFNFDYCTLPDTIYLSNLDLRNLNGYFELTHLVNKNIVTMVVSNVDLNKLKVPLDRFDFVVADTGQSINQKIILLQQLRKLYADAGLTVQYAKFDRQFQSEILRADNHPILDIISRYWWDYGYDKGRIFYISTYAFFIFFVLNVIFFEKIKMVYFPRKFISKEASYLRMTKNPVPVKAKLYQMPGTFLFTAYLFWGLKIDLRDMTLKHWGAIILLISQYVFGIVCLAYLANYVISK